MSYLCDPFFIFIFIFIMINRIIRLFLDDNVDEKRQYNSQKAKVEPQGVA